MKEIKTKYSIGFTDRSGDFRKVWNEKGYTKKFETAEETKKYIYEILSKNEWITNIKIMQGWKVIEEIEVNK